MRQRVIVADHIHSRAEQIRVLLEDYHVQINEFRAWAELVDFLHELKQQRQQVDMLFLADRLIDSQQPPLKYRSQPLLHGTHGSVRSLICLVEHPYRPEDDRESCLVCPNSALDINELRALLNGSANGNRPRLHRKTPGPTLAWDNNARFVVEEVLRDLDPKRRLERGQTELSRILGMVSSQLEQVRIAPFAKARSGAKVLLIDPIDSTFPPFVLKLIPSMGPTGVPNSQSVFQSIANFRELENDFTEKDNRCFIPTLPTLQSPLENCADLIYSPLGWYGLAMQFLGGELGTFHNLQEAYKCHRQRPAELKDDFLKEDNDLLGEGLLRHFLQLLEDKWYSHALRESVPLWGKENRHGNCLYFLEERRKRYVFEALDELGERAERLFTCTEYDWPTCTNAIRKWLLDGPCNELLTTPFSALVSKIHGDLNSYNMLFWLENAHPFLLDFDTYQSQGPTLRDYADLEKEIKFALMNSESDGKLPALDRDSRLLEPWLKAETHLDLFDEPRDPFTLPNQVDGGYVKRAVQLIRWIRSRARHLHGHIHDGKLALPFAVEYGVALLYHTIRVIGYSNLSDWKRMLAVVSAARLIRSISDQKVIMAQLTSSRLSKNRTKRFLL